MKLRWTGINFACRWPACWQQRLLMMVSDEPSMVFALLLLLYSHVCMRVSWFGSMCNRKEARLLMNMMALMGIFSELVNICRGAGGLMALMGIFSELALTMLYADGCSSHLRTSRSSIQSTSTPWMLLSSPISLKGTTVLLATRSSLSRTHGSAC